MKCHMFSTKERTGMVQARIKFQGLSVWWKKRLGLQHMWPNFPMKREKAYTCRGENFGAHYNGRQGFFPPGVAISRRKIWNFHNNEWKPTHAIRAWRIPSVLFRNTEEYSCHCISQFKFWSRRYISFKAYFIFLFTRRHISITEISISSIVSLDSL